MAIAQTITYAINRFKKIFCHSPSLSLWRKFVMCVRIGAIACYDCASYFSKFLQVSPRRRYLRLNGKCYSTFSIGATLGIILVTPMAKNFTAKVAFFPLPKI